MLLAALWRRTWTGKIEWRGGHDTPSRVDLLHVCCMLLMVIRYGIIRELLSSLTYFKSNVCSTGDITPFACMGKLIHYYCACVRSWIIKPQQYTTLNWLGIFFRCLLGSWMFILWQMWILKLFSRRVNISAPHKRCRLIWLLYALMSQHIPQIISHSV